MNNNYIHIQNICNYLEEIGIIDKISVNSFLKLYSYAISKINNNNFNNINPNYSSSAIFENVLCAYLKKIFTIEKNFLIFSNKIINRFKENYCIKFVTIISNIIMKKYNYYISKSFYNIISNFKEYNSKDKNLKHSKNQTCYSYRNLISKKTKNFFNEKKIDTPINKSLDWVNINIDGKIKEIKESYDNLYENIDKKNHPSIKNDSYRTLQLENKKKLFMSKIQKEHSINFKKSKIINENNNSKGNSRNKTNINYETINNDFMLKNNTIECQKSYRTMRNMRNNRISDDNFNCGSEGEISYIEYNENKNDIYYNNENFIKNENDIEGSESMRVISGNLENAIKNKYFKRHENQTFNNFNPRIIKSNFPENSSQEINRKSNMVENYCNNINNRKGFIKKKNDLDMIKENKNKQQFNKKRKEKKYNKSNNIFTLEEIQKIQNKLKSLSIRNFEK